MSPSRSDRLLAVVLKGSALSSVAIVLLIVGFVTVSALPALREIGIVRLLTDHEWNPTSPVVPTYGMARLLAGSIAVTLGAILLAGPAGVMSAVFINYYSPKLCGEFYKRIIELLAGVPSIVLGFWGLVAIVPLINHWHPPGQSLLAGSIVLGLMVMPTVALTSDAALRSVPQDYHRAAMSLGIGRWSFVSGVALSHARTGILSGLLLAVARAIGETMVVVLVCGNALRWPTSIFSPMRTVTAHIALEMSYAGSMHQAALFAAAVLLIALISLGIVVVTMQRGRSASRAPADQEAA